MSDSPPPVLAAHVVSVSIDGSFTCMWTFDSDIQDCSDATGFRVAGQNGQFGYINDPRTIAVNYEEPISIGAAWSATPGQTDITFDPARTLAAGSGTVV